MAKRIVDELASCDVKLVASLPDNWITELVDTIDKDERFTHVPVNREGSAVGLRAGAYMGGTGAVALMGASGFMSLIYAITKINYSYEIPLCILITLRGAFGDHHKHHVSNGLSLRPILDTINLPYTIVDKPEDSRRPTFQAEAEKIGTELDPSTGEEVEKIVEKIASIPPAVTQR